MDFYLAITSLFITLTILIVIQKYFLKNNLVDNIVSRSSHSSVATRSGGLSIFTTLFLMSAYFYLDGKILFDYSLVVPLLLLATVGIYDDINNLDFKLKFIFQVIAAKIIIDNGLIIDNLHGFLGVYDLTRVVAQLLTIFIIVSIINAVNFIDGIDGLAILILIIFIISFEFYAYQITPFKNLSIILISSLIVTSFLNFRKKNKVFLGDSGSLFLGGVASIYIVYILSNEYIIKPDFDLHKIIFVFSIFLYPSIDIIRIVFLRIINGSSPFQPDKNHIHHLILKKTKSHIITTLLISCFTIFTMFLLQLIF